MDPIEPSPLGVRTEQAAAQVKAVLGTRSNVEVVIDQTGVFHANRVVLANLENMLVGMNILDRYTGLTLVFGRLERDYSNLNPRSRLLNALIELFDEEEGFLAMGFLGLATLDKAQEMIATKA